MILRLVRVLSVSRTIGVRFVLLLGLLSHACFPQHACCAELKQQLADEPSLAVVQMLETKLRANYEKVSTWSGTYQLKDESRRGSMPGVNGADRSTAANKAREAGDFWMERDVLVRFAIDMKHNKVFTTYESVGPDKYTNLKTGEKREIASLLNQRHILTAEHWIQSMPAPGVSDGRPVLARGKGRPSAVRDVTEKSERFMTYSTIISPERLFGFGKTPTFEHLHLYATALKEGPPGPMRVFELASDEGVIYTLTAEYRMGGPESDETPIVAEYLFHPTSGYHLTSRKLVGTTGKLEEVEEWDYTLVSGLYLPKRHYLARYRPDSDVLSLRREFVSLDMRVNEPLAEDAFTWNALGLQEGDEIIDRIEGKTFRYKGGKLIAAVDEPNVNDAAATEIPFEGSRSRLVIVNFGLLGVVVVLLIAVKKYRASRSTRRS